MAIPSILIGAIGKSTGLFISVITSEIFNYAFSNRSRDLYLVFLSKSAASISGRPLFQDGLYFSTASIGESLLIITFTLIVLGSLT